MIFADISEYYEGDLVTSEEDAWNTVKEYKRNLAQVARVVKERNVKGIVEVGCGSGLIPVELPEEVRYLGIDKNPAFLNLARNKNRPMGRTFVLEDVRNVTPVWFKDQGHQAFDLVMSFAFFKHFGLHEWDDIVKGALALAPLGCIEVQTSTHDFNNGSQFHHVFVTQERLERVIREAGHKYLYDVVVHDGSVAEGRIQAKIVATEMV
jgi:SAM-dependent methyltransferase